MRNFTAVEICMCAWCLRSDESSSRMNLARPLHKWLRDQILRRLARRGSAKLRAMRHVMLVQQLSHDVERMKLCVSCITYDMAVACKLEAADGRLAVNPLSSSRSSSSGKVEHRQGT